MQNIKGMQFTDLLILRGGEYTLGEIAKEIVQRGGHDELNDDQMLMLEIIAKLDGVSQNDLQTFFLSIRESCGEDARYALKHGHVTFEKRLQ